MRTSQMVVMVATHTGWPLEYIGRLSYRRLAYLVAEIDYQRRCEAYRIEYRIGQVICTLASDKTHKYKPEQVIGDTPKMLEVTINMTGEIKTQSVILGDGNNYDLAALDINIMEAIEEEFDKAWDELLAHPRATVIKAIVFHMLKASYPDLTRDQVGALLTTKILGTVTSAIAKMG